MVDQILRPAADPDHRAILDGDVAGASVAAEDAGGLHPPVNVALCDAVVQDLVHPDRPQAVQGVRGPGSLTVGYSVDHLTPS